MRSKRSLLTAKAAIALIQSAACIVVIAAFSPAERRERLDHNRLDRLVADTTRYLDPRDATVMKALLARAEPATVEAAQSAAAASPREGCAKRTAQSTAKPRPAVRPI